MYDKSQLMKGTLEGCILQILSETVTYGYEIVTTLTEFGFEDVKEGNVKLLDTVKLFIYFTYFVKKGLIDYDIKTIESVFLNGMNLASVKSKYFENG